MYRNGRISQNCHENTYFVSHESRHRQLDVTPGENKEKDNRK